MEYVDLAEKTVLGALPPQYLALYNEAIENGNPHAKTFPIMNPFHAFLIGIAYLVIIFVGMAIMKNVKKFELTYFSLLHNGMMVALNGYMLYEITRCALELPTYFGNGPDPSPKGLPLARVLWLFYFSKPVEFIDTFIMVLKKNFHQVSFLHVYHHVATFWIWWGVIYYACGGDTYVSAGMNCFIHVLMYGYYFLASLKVPCPWKKYLTQAQMFQFFLNLCHALYIIFVPTPYPKLWAYVLLFYMITLLFLFGNFYIKSNSRPRTTATTSKTATKKQN